MSKRDSLTHLDLFSGIGGFALAARWAGIETVAFCEIDTFCQKVLRKNFPDVSIFKDVKDLQFVPYVDLLTAGFPCQPFSVAGKQKGKDDDRYLWPEVIRLIRSCKPSWVILENVPGIIPMLDPILEDLENERYSWQAFLIPASAVYAPHKRERLWIVANRDSFGFDERRSDWEKRSIQGDWERYVKTLQSEWAQFQPKSWPSFNTQNWLESPAHATSERSSGTGAFGKSLHTAQNRERQTGNVVDDSDNSEFISTVLYQSDSQTDKTVDAERSGGEAWPIDSRQHRTSEATFDWEKDQPPVPGVDDGLPYGMDRNKALGNAIVPQIPYLFMKMIMEIEGR